MPLSTTWLYSDAVKGEALNVLFADVRDPAFRGMADLTSGHWATGAGEVVVTATGAHRGLPTSGPLSLTTEIPDGAEGVRKVAFTQQVVGTGTAYLAEPVDLVMLSRPDLVAAGGPVSGMLVDRPAPVTWTEVRRLNGYGFAVASRSVAADPPADAATQDFPGSTSDSNESTLLVVALAAPGPGLRPTGRVRRLVARLAAPALGAVFVGWSSWLLGGHDLTIALVAALRVLALVAPGAIVLPYVDPDALGDQLCRWLRLPARPVVAAGAVLSRFQALTVLWAEISAIRRVRGVADGRGSVARFRQLAATTVALLTGALASATTLAVAMDARGFASVRRRTWLHPAVWRPGDLVALLAGLSVVLTAAAF